MTSTRADEERDARARLVTLAPQLPGQNWDRARWVESDSNDAWELDDLVLRVCWRGERHRLLREVVVGRALPAAMRYPETISAGQHGDVTWQLARRVPGIVLAHLWLHMDVDELRRLVAELATMLRTLHAWAPTPAVVQGLTEREDVPANLVGANLLPLPVSRARALISEARQLPFLDADLLRGVERRIERLETADPFANPAAFVVVHGDAQPTNIIVADDGIAALLDYEWCRLAPVDAELAIWMHVLRVAAIRHPARLLPPVLAWLREDYAEMFAAPDIDTRLWLYAITFALQGSLAWPPDAPESDLVAEHHVHALRALVDRPPPALTTLR